MVPVWVSRKQTGAPPPQLASSARIQHDGAEGATEATQARQGNEGDTCSPVHPSTGYSRSLSLAVGPSGCLAASG